MAVIVTYPMVSVVFEDAVLFAVIAGVIASVFSVLAWYVFQQTPVRRVFAALTALVVIGTVYHVLLLVTKQHAIRVVGENTTGLEAVRSLMYTAVAVVVLASIYFNRTADRNLE